MGAQVLQEWRSMTDYMHHRVFGWELRTGAGGLKEVPVPEGGKEARPIVWMQNVRGASGLALSAVTSRA